MKIERKEKEFEPVVITIETREELEHLFGALCDCSKSSFENSKRAQGVIYGHFNGLILTEIIDVFKKVM